MFDSPFVGLTFRELVRENLLKFLYCTLQFLLVFRHYLVRNFFFTFFNSQKVFSRSTAFIISRFFFSVTPWDLQFFYVDIPANTLLGLSFLPQICLTTARKTGVSFFTSLFNCLGLSNCRFCLRSFLSVLGVYPEHVSLLPLLVQYSVPFQPIFLSPYLP